MSDTHKVKQVAVIGGRQFGRTTARLFSLAQECEAERAKVKDLSDALEGMLAAYGELHALFDIGDCEASIKARAALKRARGEA